MNKWRRILCISVIAIFAAGIISVPEFLGIYSIWRWEMALVIPLICMVVIITQYLSGFVQFCYKVKEWLAAKFKKKNKKYTVLE